MALLLLSELLLNVGHVDNAGLFFGVLQLRDRAALSAIGGNVLFLVYGVGVFTVTPE